MIREKEVQDRVQVLVAQEQVRMSQKVMTGLVTLDIGSRNPKVIRKVAKGTPRRPPMSSMMDLGPPPQLVFL